MRKLIGAEQHKFYTTHELGALLDISYATINHWIDQGKIEAVRTLGGHRRIAIKEVKRVAEIMRIEI